MGYATHKLNKRKFPVIFLIGQCGKSIILSDTHSVTESSSKPGVKLSFWPAAAFKALYSVAIFLSGSLAQSHPHLVTHWKSHSTVCIEHLSIRDHVTRISIPKHLQRKNCGEREGTHTSEKSMTTTRRTCYPS